MSLEFTRTMNKVDEYFCREIEQSAIDFVEEHYEKPWHDLTKEEVTEIAAFAEDNQWSVLSNGFRSVVNMWESDNMWEDD